MANENMMSFIEHLAELRKRLIIMVVALLVGIMVTWNFSDYLLVYIEKPLTGQTYLSDVKKKGYALVKKRFPALYEQYGLEKQAQSIDKPRMLNFTSPMEPFFVQCKLSAIGGFILAIPILFQQVWSFIAPGLTRRERRFAVPFVTAASLCFCIGAVFFITLIWPLMINFSLSYESEGLQSWFNLSAYVNFCIKMLLVFGFMFELPILSLLLSRLGLVSGRLLAKNRKYALLASSIIGAVIGDLVTMLVIMVPMYAMYELSILVAYLFARKKKSETAAV